MEKEIIDYYHLCSTRLGKKQHVISDMNTDEIFSKKELELFFKKKDNKYIANETIIGGKDNNKFAKLTNLIKNGAKDDILGYLNNSMKLMIVPNYLSLESPKQNKYSYEQLLNIAKKKYKSLPNKFIKKDSLISEESIIVNDKILFVGRGSLLADILILAYIRCQFWNKNLPLILDYDDSRFTECSSNDLSYIMTVGETSFVDAMSNKSLNFDDKIKLFDSMIISLIETYNLCAKYNLYMRDFNPNEIYITSDNNFIFNCAIKSTLICPNIIIKNKSVDDSVNDNPANNSIDFPINELKFHMSKLIKSSQINYEKTLLYKIKDLRTTKDLINFIQREKKKRIATSIR